MLKTNHFLIDNAIFLKKLLPTLAETEGEPIANQYFFDSANVNGPTIKINSADGVFGAIQFPVFNLKKRDKIRVICEIMSFSGVLPKLTLDKSTGGTLDNTNNTTYAAGEWVQFDETFNISTDDKDFKVICGLFTTDVGIFAIRNLKVVIYSDSCITLPDERVFAIRKSATEWFLDNNKGCDSGTLVVLNSQTLQLILTKPFKYFGTPISFPVQDYSSDIRMLAGSEDKTQIFLRFKNVAGVNLNLADMPENFYGYLRVIQTF